MGILPVFINLFNPKTFAKKLPPWPPPCFPAAKVKAPGAQMEMHCRVDKNG
jgi:hypothetical protein